MPSVNSIPVSTRNAWFVCGVRCDSGAILTRRCTAILQLRMSVSGAKFAPRLRTQRLMCTGHRPRGPRWLALLPAHQWRIRT